jgi:RNA polymerase sigma-70 factor (ECF subfamily)
MPTNDDIVRIARGDVAAFRTLYDEMLPRVYYYVCRWMFGSLASSAADRAVCEDIAQETFVKYWNNRHNFTELMAVKVYLFAVARNLMLNHSRVEAGRRRILERITADQSCDEDDVLISAEMSAIILSEVDRLPAQTARVIRLSMCDRSVAQIAAELGISENTVKDLKKSGYRKLREKLAGLRPLLSFILSA